MILYITKGHWKVLGMAHFQEYLNFFDAHVGVDISKVYLTLHLFLFVSLLIGQHNILLMTPSLSY